MTVVHLIWRQHYSSNLTFTGWGDVAIRQCCTLYSVYISMFAAKAVITTSDSDLDTTEKHNNAILQSVSYSLTLTLTTMT